jgi:hypothetical protein
MVYKIPWVMERAKAQRATAGALKNSLPMAWPLNLPRVRQTNVYRELHDP